MLGAVIGDIVGSRFEWRNTKSKEFTLFEPSCSFTDDSVMTLAVAQALLDSNDSGETLASAAVRRMQSFGRRWARGCYGGSFERWLMSEEPHPYGSFGNGAAMRVSACAWAASSLDEALDMAHCVTAVTHDHPEGLKGAAAVTTAVWLAREGKSRDTIRDCLTRRFYKLDRTLEQIRPVYGFDMTCQGSVPQALTAFLESSDFEDAIRNAVSLGGDSDTIAAIAGSVAEACYGIPSAIRGEALACLDDELRGVVTAFEKRFPARILD